MARDVVGLQDDARILSVLERERVWSAYALCDLEPPYRDNARYVGALRDGTATAIVLLYTLPGLAVLLPCGDHDGVRAILTGVWDLPGAAFLMAHESDLPAIARRYHVDDAWTMLRMAVEAADIQTPPPVEATVRALDTTDLPALWQLYGQDTHFAPAMLERGVFYGAFADGALAAAAGTHALSGRYRTAVIGNMFTHPDHRGRGLATAVTGAVVRDLAGRGIHDMALNVRADNTPAIRAYRRLGFTTHLTFYEGNATLHT